MEFDNAQIFQINQLKSPDFLSDFFADLLSKFNIDFNSITEDTKRKLVIIEYLANKNSQSKVIARTGIQRHYIRKILKQYKESSSEEDFFNEPKKELTKNQYLHYVRQELNTFCSKEGRDFVTRFEFEDIVERVSKGEVTTKTWLSELIDQGMIEERDTKLYLCPFDSEKYKANTEYLGELVDSLNKVLSTVYHNHPDKRASNPLFHRLYRSTQVSPESAIVLEYEIRKMSEVFWEAVKEKVIEHESDVPVGTFEETGAMLMQFNLNKNS